MLAHQQLHHALARTTRTNMLQLEFTTRCDLKCTYCAVSQPEWVGIDLDLSTYDQLISEAKAREVRVLNLHGHGETTMLDGWVGLAHKAVSTGAYVVICSNFAHSHSKEETDALAVLGGVTVSIDTADEVLFKRLRRGGDLRTLVMNLTKLRSRCQELGRSGPALCFSSVLSDLTWRGMPDLVNLGCSFGVRTFCVCNLTVNPVPKGGVELRHVSTLPPPELIELKSTLKECDAIATRRGAHFHLKAGITDTIEANIA